MDHDAWLGVFRKTIGVGSLYQATRASYYYALETVAGMLCNEIVPVDHSSNSTE